MGQSAKDRRRERRVKLIAMIAMLAFAAILLTLMWRAWLNSLSGCAIVLRDAEYVEDGESSIRPAISESAEPRTFTDGDYDAVFPDLKEVED